MFPKEKKSFSHYMRILHRDIGFFAIGLVIIYSLSGIVLIYKDSSLFKVDKEVVKQLSPGLEASAVSGEVGNLGRGPGGGFGGGRPEGMGNRPQGAPSFRESEGGNIDQMPNGKDQAALGNEQNGAGTEQKAANQEGGRGRGMRGRGLTVVKEEGDMVYFDRGTYNRASGEFKMTMSEVMFPINKMVELHKAGSKSNTHFMITAFAIVLIFLAISSFWMFKKGHPNFKRGFIFAAAGILFSVVLFFI